MALPALHTRMTPLLDSLRLAPYGRTQRQQASSRAGSPHHCLGELPQPQARQQKPKHKHRSLQHVQCYKCQQLGHVAGVCRNAVACLKCAAAHDTRNCPKPRGAPSRCANCGGPHAANSRSCSYRRQHTTASSEVPAAKSAALPPRSGEGRASCRVEAATDQALADLQAAIAAERAATRDELVAVHQQLQQLREELWLLKKAPPVPAPPAPVRQPLG
ncbi:uncharacterized protein LOC126481970 [Schistocerca serialis cubense]|uniref:uncharacterized protein LOC126481970 n=1 Tax=Schistocerca serialis cubense TaxID=2023355 RepID=UPI00214E8864|nr:uncharacterized protein LOC126481970 [Schistocerca serialis cubense]